MERVDPNTGPLDFLWRSAPDFRDALKKVLALSASTLDKFDSITKESFELPDSALEELDVDEETLAVLTRVTRTLYGMNSRIDDIDLPGEIRRIVAREQIEVDDLENKLLLLGKLLEGRPEADKEQIRTDVEVSFLPVLQAVQLTVDLRVVQLEEKPIQIGLVPVLLGRLTFDEEVQGSKHVTFQLPTWQLDQMIERFQDLKDELAAVEKQAGDKLL